MHKLKDNLLVKVILAIVLGIVLGGIIPEAVGRIFMTFNDFFSELLNFLIPLIIVGLIIPSIGRLGQTAGKLLLATVLIAYGSTIFSGLLGYSVSMSVFPSLLEHQTGQINLAEKAKEFTPYFSIEFPPLFDVMPALVFSFLFGIGLSRLKDSTFGKFADDFEEIITYLIQNLIIPLLPIFIFGIFLNMSYSGQVVTIMNVFLKIIGVIFVLHVFLLVLQFTIAGIITKKNPFTMMKLMLPAYFTALGTQSSAATIPITIAQVKKIGVRDEIANFAVPLCATIHLSGSMLKIVCCCLALMLIQGIEIDFVQFLGFIMMLGIAMVAAPGVPGGAIMAAIGIIASMLGFNAENQALMIALYIAMDSFGTAGNVTGDGAIAVTLNKLFKKEVQ
ncbi:dicarboxylate/amino acid:cation symporter [Empedobacter falsenii]|uniref:Dicarboxylate/amino acid:cation symporter n=1 Tax=Empedobacter falsenii TaxID=343874 RepID=A0A427BQ04_9FLAO|nr:dicarboxylate/amino acid:cation symporter [Empedobacter falsenii]RRT91801.1 dicarboxylate/amino acid:cation symporter [Empedobacter falsenii]RRT92338.1 dicarboxylate/amino acid:cation symporter [Empedobacter falsenii]